MAAGRTVSANFLTESDKKVITLCSQISDILINSIEDKEAKKEFKNTFAKMSKTTRDSGQGLGGGKLQRDALCTRGIGGLAPFSNRNLRWHPLVVAAHPISFAKPIERIEIEIHTLYFIVKDVQGNEVSYPSEKVFELPERYVVLPHHWFPHIETIKHWEMSQWNQNACVITAYEACEWHDAVQAYASLGISVVTGFYEVDFHTIYNTVKTLLENQQIDISLTLPTSSFPTEKEDMVCCPLCKSPANENPAQLPDRHRERRWKPEWGSNKRGEGDDSSLQIMHVEPLTESEIRHNAKNVRFGHRWCNVAMTDHSVAETVDFMAFIVNAHNKI